MILLRVIGMLHPSVEDLVGAVTRDRRHGSHCVSSGVAESQTVCSIGCAHIAVRPLGSEMLRGTGKALRLLLHGPQDRKGDALRLAMLRDFIGGFADLATVPTREDSTV